MNNPVEIDQIKINNILFDVQSSVIKDSNYLSIPDLPKYVFWKYIFPRNSRIVSAEFQYNPAKSFWSRRINESWNTYYVYLIQGSKILEELTPKSLEEKTIWLWGEGSKYMERKIAISKDKIII